MKRLHRVLALLFNFNFNLCILQILPTRSCAKDTFVITGSTGALGNALVKCALQIYPSSTVYRGYRSSHALHACMSQLPSTKRVVPFLCDVNTPIDSSTVARILGTPSSSTRIVWINNAGVCLEGRSLESMQKSISVNALGPSHIANQLIEAYDALGYTDKSDKSLHIVNVSSGDGELLYLASSLAKQVELLTSQDDWRSFVRTFLQEYSCEVEVAYGSTPSYSVSKALLNASTRVLHSRLLARGNSSVRVIAVCPGNFRSAMTSEEELASAVDADLAAAHVLDAAADALACPGGHFYRRKERIPW